MRIIQISDTTLAKENNAFGFKEKLQIVRHLEKLNVDVIELDEIRNEKADTLFVRTCTSMVKNAVLSVAAGSDMKSIASAGAALKGARRAAIRIELPLSPVGMEYTSRKKPDTMLTWIETCVTEAKKYCEEVEFCALDATRADVEYVKRAMDCAVSAGAASVTICDCAAEMLPDDFASFVGSIIETVNVPVAVRCRDLTGLSQASAVLAVRVGAAGVKTDLAGTYTSLESFAEMMNNCGKHYDLSTAVAYTQLRRIVGQIRRILSGEKNEKFSSLAVAAESSMLSLDEKDDSSQVSLAVQKLGYDLSEEDQARVYEEFCRVAAKKRVGYKELDAIVASVALQVPATYRLVNYVVQSGNIISASAQITLSKGEEQLQGISIGDGPLDAAFRTVDQILGHHYELDDFQIQSVTEGKEAMGSALVKLRSKGKIYSGNGISTDIIGAGIRAYLNAVNKIVYEEA